MISLNDSDDFALTGLNANDELITYVVANGINTFIPTYILQGVYYGKPAWGDYDADGDLDLLITGHSSTEGQLGSAPVTVIYYQDENGFSVDQTLSIAAKIIMLLSSLYSKNCLF